MTVTGAAIVQKAESYKGRAENPLGSNTGPFVIACQRATFLAGTGWPWCAAYVCRVAAECGVPLTYPSAGADDLYNHYKAAGYAVSLADAKSGDVVDFAIGSGHTGILVSKGQPGYVTTIDGNWNDRVELVNHPVSVVRGVWRIPSVVHHTHEPPPPTPRPVRLPPFVVATSASGHRKVVFRAKTKKGLISWLGAHNLARLFPNGVTITRAKR